MRKIVAKFSKFSGIEASDPVPQGIKTWYEPEIPAVDIVFIHRLTGDRERTWTYPQMPSYAWPETFLPSKIPDARLLTFGYDA